MLSAVGRRTRPATLLYSPDFRWKRRGDFASLQLEHKSFVDYLQFNSINPGHIFGSLEFSRKDAEHVL